MDQLRVTTDADLLPVDHDARDSYETMLAMDATIYGLASVFQYAQLYEQAVDVGSDVFTGFNRFLHERELATPAFTAFKTPNVDTLYSNAWLDLTGGPVLVEIPPIPDRYFTLQFVDMYGNSTNLSSRTVGGSGGRFLVATTTWDGVVPSETTPFRVATPYIWILMRILVKGPNHDVEHVRSLQDAVTLTATADSVDGGFVPVTFAEVQHDAVPFFQALDWTLRQNGHPVQETGLVQRLRSIGIGCVEPFDVDARDERSAANMDQGFREAMRIVSSARGQVGARGGTGWNTGTAGENGLNYLRRAVQNFVGTGGNVEAEKKFFVTFEDAEGRTLDGSIHSYVLTFDAPPPADGHWSLTVYPQATGFLYPNEIDRYALGATSDLTTNAQGAIEVVLQHTRPPSSANWLPVPAEPFYIDLRMWEPRTEARDGRWLPPPVQAAGDETVR